MLAMCGAIHPFSIVETMIASRVCTAAAGIKPYPNQANIMRIETKNRMFKT